MMLRGKKCVLRPLSSGDARKLSDMIGDMEIMQYLQMVFPINDIAESKWIEKLYKGYPQNHIVFGIVVDGELVGTVGLHNINWTSRHATFGIAIWKREYIGKGIGTEATKLILDYAFDFLNMHRIKLEVYEYNTRAIGVYKKLGFVEEGRLRKQRYLRGQYYDVIVMGILKEEWYTLRDALNS